MNHSFIIFIFLVIFLDWGGAGTINEDLVDAARDCKFLEVKQILNNNPDVDLDWRDYSPPFMTALEYVFIHEWENRHQLPRKFSRDDCRHTAQVLLHHRDSNGRSVNINNQHKGVLSVVHQVFRRGDVLDVKLFLYDQRADCNLLHPQMGAPPLDWAFQEGRLDQIKWAMASGRVRNEPKDLKKWHLYNESFKPLLEKFLADPERTKQELRVELGITDFPLINPPDMTWEEYTNFFSTKNPVAPSNPPPITRQRTDSTATFIPSISIPSEDRSAYSAPTLQPSLSSTEPPLSTLDTQPSCSFQPNTESSMQYIEWLPILIAIFLAPLALLTYFWWGFEQKKLEVELLKQEKLEVELEVKQQRDQIASLEFKLDNQTPYSLLFTEKAIKSACEDFDEKRRIGEGGFGVVYRGRLKCDQAVAIKRIKQDKWNTQSRLRDEIKALSRYRHPNLITLVGHTDLSLQQPCLVYDLMPNGNLRDHLDFKYEFSFLKWPDRIRIAYEISSALDYLHRPIDDDETPIPPLLHQDVKSSNILLGIGYHAKLADFGLVKFLDENSPLSTEKSGTNGYLCPDYCSRGVPSTKTDVYAFGVVLAEMLTGNTALLNETQRTTQLAELFRREVINKTPIDKGFVDPLVAQEWPESICNDFAWLTRECLGVDPDPRPSMEIVKKRLKNLVDRKSDKCHKCQDLLPDAKLPCCHEVICAHCAVRMQREKQGCPNCGKTFRFIKLGSCSSTYVPSSEKRVSDEELFSLT